MRWVREAFDMSLALGGQRVCERDMRSLLHVYVRVWRNFNGFLQLHAHATLWMWCGGDVGGIGDKAWEVGN